MELAQIAAEVSELLQNSRSMDNKRETIFELLRRSCLKSAREGSLEASMSERGMSDVWLFLLTLRKTSPVRKRRVDECLKALSSSERWMSLLERPQLKEALLDSDPDCRDLLSTTSFEAVFEAVPEVEAVEMPEAPAPVPVSKGNPFERFSALSPKAQVGTMAFSAALEVKETKEAKETSGASGASVAQRVTEGVATAARRTVDFEQRHQLTRRAAEATRSTVEAAREANERYGVTEKIGQGISTAAAKTVEFERQHQVSSRAMQGVKASVDAARDANERYHITEKMGQGASAAYAKAKDLEEKHQVSSKVANGLKSGASTVASAASTVASKNPFAARQRNPFAAR